MAKRKTIFGKILGGITSVAGTAISAATGIPGLGNLGIGAKGDSAPAVVQASPIATAPAPTISLAPETLREYASTLQPVKAQTDYMPWILGSVVLGGLLLSKK